MYTNSVLLHNKSFFEKNTSDACNIHYKALESLHNTPGKLRVALCSQTLSHAQGLIVCSINAGAYTTRDKALHVRKGVAGCTNLS